MSAPDLNDLHTQSNGLHALLYMLYEASCDLDYASDNAPAVVAANRVNSLIILARDEAERLDAGIGQCIEGRRPVAPANIGEPIFELGKLSLDALFSMHDALGTISDVISAISCQPRFCSEGLSPAGEMLEKLAEFVEIARGDIHDEGAARPSATERERWLRFYFLANRAVDGSSSPEHSLADVASAAAAVGKAVKS
ncbi:hypothetical protein [Mesorhizobium sp. B2-3-4]|uniref:hypothetical protein n=1 Tax=Mesorhizobium sp. B2-3-4 TaxID=2589959 RepID=UPI00112A09AE|nr:hypothetical protein [Mesorhizobium sp. B2-3-4]TPM25685.1 hypothetical protein FJ967_32165 [Mesorhizobium sp. B2-3-4]